MPTTPAAGLIRVDAMQQTIFQCVYAAHDVATPMQPVSQAVYAGTMAAAALVHRLNGADLIRGGSSDQS